MFDNIDRKIKVMAKVAIVLSIISLAVVIIGGILYITNAESLKYSYVDLSKYPSMASSVKSEISTALTGQAMVQYGLFACVGLLIISFPIYGFGELIGNSASCVEKQEKILQHLSSHKTHKIEHSEQSTDTEKSYRITDKKPTHDNNSDGWKCPDCGDTNHVNSMSCRNCGKSK